MDAMQDKVIAFLSDPAAHGGAAVERVATHCSLVFLAGPRAYKLKRAVRFPYLDYGTLERRRAFVEAEVAINRRTAPMLYEGTVPVTLGPDGGLALGGTGETVEWLVAMRRFAADALFDAMARAGTLGLGLIEDAARAIARFHAEAAVVPKHGGAAAIHWLLGNNRKAFAPSVPDIFAAPDIASLEAAQRAELDRHASLLDARRARGFVRRCHGDLHLRNIVLVDGRAVPFDGIEFDERLACIDVLYDLAFLLMDLGHRGMARHANAAMNAYFERGGTDDGLALLPLFLSLRATVRAHVGATAALLSGEGAQAEEARAYLAEARAHLAPAVPRMVAVGGLSGTGKSQLARGLAPQLGPVPGALVLRSDVIRKRQAGVAPSDRLPPEAYAPAVTASVYAALVAEARAALAAGRSVVADAVFGQAPERAAIEGAARAAGARFDGLWLSAPLSTRETRVGARTGDASDATIDVVRRQDELSLDAPEWAQLDASGTPDATLARARRVVGTG